MAFTVFLLLFGTMLKSYSVDGVYEKGFILNNIENLLENSLYKKYYQQKLLFYTKDANFLYLKQEITMCRKQKENNKKDYDVS